MKRIDQDSEEAWRQQEETARRKDRLPSRPFLDRFYQHKADQYVTQYPQLMRDELERRASSIPGYFDWDDFDNLKEEVDAFESSGEHQRWNDVALGHPSRAAAERPLDDAECRGDKQHEEYPKSRLRQLQLLAVVANRHIEPSNILERHLTFDHDIDWKQEECAWNHTHPFDRMTHRALKARYYEARRKGQLREAFFDQLDKLLPSPNRGVSVFGLTIVALARELRGASAVQRKRMRDAHSRGPRAWEFYLWKLAQEHTDMIEASSPAQSPWPAVRPEVAEELKHGSRKRQPFAEYLGGFSDDIAEIRRFASPGRSWLDFITEWEVEAIATELPLTEENRKRFLISDVEMRRLEVPALKLADLITRAKAHMLDAHRDESEPSVLHVHHEDGRSTAFLHEWWKGTGTVYEQVLEARDEALGSATNRPSRRRRQGRKP